AGAGQVEEAAAFGERGGGDRVGVDEDVHVVEGGDEADVLGEEHAVAEDVAAHVADADGGEVLRLGVEAFGAEVAFHGFPCASCGDAHLLVVVADGAA
ncbi:hypothetical protein ADL26_05155, partial [Thermoactinomyces vulgaris]